ncbi:ABC transporter ATP-binding protein [Shewanella eurypsychrophilus]|uniref:ABC transporter ATP-binding protein n=1 Tax=Shewanella eurypsychrophilus TaxID=2593656 RepID=A0ABX6VEE2_9GAMM|nr:MULTISPECIES: ABC transporter ATP-binding protein [Shewanella]QFU25032.1 ATP-binding cassette domain-containing protein [Shewanella sp. YLB-09]QPG60208.1 ABC transporter ATP-binding protein [Shewanella eurypsychrophilus]
MDVNQAPILEFSKVTKRFSAKATADKTALNELSMSLYPGMVVGLLGQNGAGKSTLMRCALGIIEPNSGSITTLGEPVHQLSSAAKAQIGYVPQQPFGYEGFSVSRSLELHRSFYPEWDRALEDTWLERFDLDPAQQVQRLSVGQRQSLALIMAMAYRPKLLILDEPVASLDPIARRKFMSDLFELALDSGSAVLFSSHITSDLERVASHLALMKSGKLVLFKEMDSVREQVKLLSLGADDEVPGDLHVLNHQGNKVLVDNFNAAKHQSIHAESLNLEQLFMELHR